jgi:hypothetical protein
MNLKAINKQWINKNNLSDCLNMPLWVSEFMLELSYVFGLNDRKVIDGVKYYGKLS